MTNCRICNNKLLLINNFGEMPIANAFQNKVNNAQFTFNLQTGFCNKCFMFQLIDQPPPEKMFHQDYAFSTRSSMFMIKHFQNVAKMIKTNFISDPNDNVLEIGCNDGVMLEQIQKYGVKNIGVEPSANVAEKSKEIGLEIINDFFSEELALNMKNNSNYFKVIYASNVICHLPDLNDLCKGITKILKKDGIFIFEEPYLASIIKKNSFDQIYDEHIYFYCILSLNNLFQNYNLEIFDSEEIWTHGGSMRYFVSFKGKYPQTERFRNSLHKEVKLKLDREETYLNFNKNCEKIKYDINQTLADLKNKNNEIVGYGATSKSTTFINYCDISKYINFISDTSHSKINKFTPLSNIPIKDYSSFQESCHSFTILFAWNHMKEIFKKETEYFDNGGNWIVYVPEVKIISKEEIE